MHNEKGIFYGAEKNFSYSRPKLLSLVLFIREYFIFKFFWGVHVLAIKNLCEVYPTRDLLSRLGSLLALTVSKDDATTRFSAST